MKKNLGYIGLAILVFSMVFTTGIDSAKAYYSCGSDDVRCRSVRMFYGQKTFVKTSQVYFYANESIYYSWDNDKPGIMQVGFSIYNAAGKRVSPEKVAVREGDNYGIWPVPTSGYYYLLALCEGGNDTRCEGGGKLMKW